MTDIPPPLPAERFAAAGRCAHRLSLAQLRLLRLSQAMQSPEERRQLWIMAVSLSTALTDAAAIARQLATDLEPEAVRALPLDPT